MSWIETTNSQQQPTWITIGTFDGVHLGHQAIIHKLVKGAHNRGQGSSLKQNRALVVTFFPHPAEVLHKVKDFYYLTNPKEREELLKGLGVDEVMTLTFTPQLAEQSAREFIQGLQRKINFTCLLVGYDFRLGKDRVGDISTLRNLGRELGFKVQTITPQTLDGKVISSSSIRHMITQGDLNHAARFLGHWYSVSGEVVHGDGRGRHIGIPTANVAVWPQRLLPPNGVYITTVEMGGKTYPAVLNIGYRPTFYSASAERTFEVHILDFQHDLYGKTIKVNLVEFLRPEKQFDSAEELMNQIRKDIQQTREVLGHAPKMSDLPA